METIDYIKDMKFSHYVDIACGQGWFTSIVINSCQNIKKVTGIDIIPQLNDSFISNVKHENIEFVGSSIADYNMVDVTPDCISISMSLHHIENIEDILKEIYKQLSDDGLLIIFEMIKDDLSQSQRCQLDFHHLNAIIDSANNHYHRIVYSKAEILKMIKTSGFKIAHEEIIKNNDISNKDEKIISNLTNRMNNQFERNYDSSPPIKIKKQFENIISNIRKYGFSPPPFCLYICQKN